MPARLVLSEMTREEIGAVAGDTTVVIPTASIEQHGPHLPILTDLCICEAVCRAAAERAAAEISVAVAPPLAFGISRHHLPYPGVVTLSSSTFAQVLREVCESLVQSGFNRLAIVNGHGGNEEAVRLVARDLVNVARVSVAATSYWSVAYASLASLSEGVAVPGHAGAFETSLMLALRPDLVHEPPSSPGVDALPARPSAPPPATSAQPFPSVVVQAGRRIGDGPGYTDHPAGASADYGRRALDLIAGDLARFLVQFHET